MPDFVRINVTGMKEFNNLLIRLGRTPAAYAAEAAFRDLLPELVKTMQALCPVDTSALQKSIGYRIKSYNRGNHTFAAVGPRYRMFRNPKTFEYPARYAHLVELKQQSFIRAAWDMHKATFAQKMADRMMAEYKRRGLL